MKNLNKIENHFIIIGLVFFLFIIIDQNLIWDSLIIPNAKKDFIDFRCIQSWGLYFDDFFKTEKLYTERIENTCALTYPKIWILISKFSFLENEYIFYLTMYSAILIYLIIFYHYIKKFKSYFFVYVFFSGSSFLLMERGNSDIFIFIFLFFFTIVNKKIFKILILLFSAVLKIYPIFAIFYFFKKRNDLLLLSLISFIFLIYLVLSIDQFKLISNAVWKTGDISFGIYAILLNIQKHLDLNINRFLVLLLFALINLIIFIGIKNKIKNLELKYKDLFLLGSGIYIILSLVGTAFDYKLIYLFFCIPLILNTNNKLFKYAFFINIFLSMEVHRLIHFFGFFGGVLNNISKMVLLCMCLQIFMYILLNHLLYKIQNEQSKTR